MEGFELKETREGFIITYKRFSIIRLLLFLFFLIISIARIGASFGDFLISVLFLIGIIYFSLAELLNETEIIVLSSYIRIQHKPFPTIFQNLNLHKKQIKNIDIRYQYENKGKHYDLLIMTKENKTYVIVPYINEYERARYLELKLKIHLGLEKI